MRNEKAVLARIPTALARDPIYIRIGILFGGQDRESDGRKLIRGDRARDPSPLPRRVNIRTAYVTPVAT